MCKIAHSSKVGMNRSLESDVPVRNQHDRCYRMTSYCHHVYRSENVCTLTYVTVSSLKVVSSVMGVLTRLISGPPYSAENEQVQLTTHIHEYFINISVITLKYYSTRHS